MSDKNESINSLKRKIEKLEAINTQIQAAFIRSQEAYRDVLVDFTDYKIRNLQALKILSGENV